MRLSIILLLCGLAHGALAQDFTRRGPLAVAEGSVLVTRTNATVFPSLLYYPATATTPGSAPQRGATPWPAICFGHGFLAPPALYAQTMRHLASWGFVVIAPQSALEFFPSHQGYADDMRQCLYWLRDQGRAPTSAWHGVVSSNRWGLSGHSMGGGANVLAAADEPEIDAVANLAAAETYPSAVDAIPNVAAAICLISGSDDRIAPPRWHTYPFYRHAGAPRLYAELQGASHCGFVDVPLPDALCDEARMPRSVQLAKSRALLSAFFRLYLHDDAQFWPLVWGPALALDPQFRTEMDPGFEVAPAYGRQRVPAGATADFPLTITNTDLAAARYVLTATGNTNGWALVPPMTDWVAPGSSTSLLARIALPAGSVRAFTIVDVRREDDARTRNFAVLGLERARR